MTGPEHIQNKPGTAEKKVKENTCSIAKENATLAQWIEILDWHHEQHKSQKETAMYFNSKYPSLHLKQPIISWLKEEAKWCQQWENNIKDCSAKHAWQTQHPEIMEMMDLWVSQAMGDGILLTGEVLCQKWTQFADFTGVPTDEHLCLSNGWLAQYKAWNGLKEFKCHGEASSVGKQTVETERECIQKIIKEGGYELWDVFNMDETGLFYG